MAEHSCSVCGGEFSEENGRLAFIGGVLIAICPWCISPLMEMFRSEIIAEYEEERNQLNNSGSSSTTSSSSD